MPWPVKDLIAVRFEFVNLALQPQANIRQLCRRFEISPTVGYKWLRRYQRDGPAALADQSRRPQRTPTRTEPEIEQQLVKLRGEHPAWGARKLRRRLHNLGQSQLPSTSTITGILHRHGLITPQQSQAASRFQRFERSAPNELWQVDFKGHFALSQGRCHPLCALDDHSRYNVLLAACANEQHSTVQTQLIGAFRCYGLPDALLWDNGSPWGCSAGEYTELDVWLMRLGVRSAHGRPYHPQTQGKEERFHRTLQAEVISRGGWSACSQVQAAFDRWRPIYNTERPHDSLKLHTPVSRYQPSQREYPESLPPVQYDVGIEVRRADLDGRITYRGQPYKVGQSFRHQMLGLRPGQTEGVMEVLFLSQVIKQLDLRHHKKPIAP
jgi:transposase InsO family protein